MIHRRTNIHLGHSASVALLLCLCIQFSGTREAQCANPEPVSQKTPVILSVGEQRLFRTPGVVRYSLGSHHVRVHPLPQRPSSWKSREKKDSTDTQALLLKGMSPGMADLWVWKKDGSAEHRMIQVIQPTRPPVSSPFEKVLNSLEETEIIFMGQGATLKGEVVTFNEWVKVGRIRDQYPKEFIDDTTLSPRLFEQGKQALEKWISSSRFSNTLKVDSSSELWVRGYIPHPSDKNWVENRLKTFFPTINLDISSNPDSAMTVHFKIFLIELNRSHFRNLGFSWPGQISESFQVSTGSLLGAAQIDWTLHQLEGKGLAKILSNPEMVVRAPGEAELFAGGEIPIQTHSRFSSNVSWRNYGLTLRLKVNEVTGPQVRLDIFTEVSHVDPQISQDKVPGLQVNRMKTQVDAKFGIPLLLSGLLQKSMREDTKGLPFLRSIPVLGKLFGSENYLNYNSEFIALLFPHSSPPLSLPRVKQILPRGHTPLPRNWIEPDQEQKLRNSEEFPWNVLE